MFADLPVYIVGGWVRDALYAIFQEKGLCGIDRAALLLRERAFCGDVDLCGEMSGEELFFALRNRGIGAELRKVNERTGTYLLIANGRQYEYTPFRRESYDAGGAHMPASIEFGVTLEEDARRRDFRCNAVYYDLKRGELIDPLGGIGDIRDRVLTAVGGLATLSSDGLRLMRLVRFAVRLGFGIEERTFAAAKQNAGLLHDIAAERKLDELKKTLSSDPSRNLAAAELYEVLGLLPYIAECGTAKFDALSAAREYPLIAFLADCAGFDSRLGERIAKFLKLSEKDRRRVRAVCLCRECDPLLLCEACAGDERMREVLLDTASGGRKDRLREMFGRFDERHTPYESKNLAIPAARVSELTSYRGARLGAYLKALWARVVREEIPNDSRTLEALIGEETR